MKALKYSKVPLFASECLVLIVLLTIKQHMWAWRFVGVWIRKVLNNVVLIVQGLQDVSCLRVPSQQWGTVIFSFIWLLLIWELKSSLYWFYCLALYGLMLETIYSGVDSGELQAFRNLVTVGCSLYYKTVFYEAQRSVNYCLLMSARSQLFLKLVSENYLFLMPFCVYHVWYMYALYCADIFTIM